MGGDRRTAGSNAAFLRSPDGSHENCRQHSDAYHSTLTRFTALRSKEYLLSCMQREIMK